MSLATSCQPLSRPLSPEEWRAYVQSLYESVQAERMDQRVSAFIEHRDMGRARMTLVSAGSMVLNANPEKQDGTMAMMLCLEGGVVLSHARRECQLKAGDWIVLDSSLPSRLEIPGRFKQLIVETPRSIWPTALRRQLTMQPRQAEDATALPAYTTAIQLWNANPALDLSRAGDALQGLMSLMHLRARAVSAARDAASIRDEATQAIARRMSDASLGPSQLAGELGVSRRHLDRLFAELGTTLEAQIWQQRLSAAANALQSPDWKGYRVLDIALEFGFKTQSHFGRRFRQLYGVTPEQWRRMQIVVKADSQDSGLITRQP